MLKTFEQPSRPLVSERQAAFSRLVARVIETLNHAVEKRKTEGQTSSEIADRIGCHKTALSRTLNGNSRNLTLKTISDILWATDFDPVDFTAEPLEKLCSNKSTYHSREVVVDCRHNTYNFYRYQPEADLSDLKNIAKSSSFVAQKSVVVAQ